MLFCCDNVNHIFTHMHIYFIFREIAFQQGFIHRYALKNRLSQRFHLIGSFADCILNHCGKDFLLFIV